MTERDPRSIIELLLEAESKKRRRLSQREKDWAILHGCTLRKRGRPRKDEPATVVGGRAARR